jgi:transposase
MKSTVTIDSLMIENAALRAELSEVREQLSRLMEQLSSHRRKLYGASSEKTTYNSKNEQLSYLEDPPGLVVVHGVDSEAETEAPPRARPKKRGEMSTRLPPNMPVEIFECTLSEAELGEHGEQMHAIGKTLVRRELKITPAKATIVEFWQTSYSCRDSERNDDTPYIIKAPLPPQVIKGSMCAPETIAHIISQKCVMGSPIYRQWQDWKRQGIPLSKQTMANWLIRCSEDYFEPIYDELYHRLLRHTLLHSDGTPFQVLREPGKSAQSMSQIWLYRTGAGAKHPIILYEYQPDKRKERPREFLKGFKGYLSTDGCHSYQSLPDDIILVGCFSHVRSYFTDALKCLKESEQPGALALIGQDYCNKLFDIDRDAGDKTYDERFNIRIEKATPVLDEFHTWLKSVEPHVSTKSKLGKAVGYTLNQWKYLINYLLDGRIECSNLRSERSIKPFVINRKNFLFATSVPGARATAVLHSITETAKESGLDPFKYMTYVLRSSAGLDIRKDANLLEQLLPENAPASCQASP